MSNLFAYGSLMYPQIWSRVVEAPCESAPGIIRSVRRMAVKSAVYPGMVRSGDAADFVEGVVYFGLSDDHLARLDRFEGSFYERLPVECELAGGRLASAFAYFFKKEYLHRLEDFEWDLRRFEAEGIHAFVDREVPMRT